MKTKKKVSKKQVAKKKVAKKKAATKQAASKNPRTTAATSAKIEAIALSRDGAWWNLTLSGGRRVRISAAAGLAARVRVGGRWAAALEKRIAHAEHEQRLFARALELLARSPRLSKADLTTHLGSDADARAAVESLAQHGWI